jgi:predicted oxidoreductase
VVYDQDLVLGASDNELLAVQFQVADLGVVCDPREHPAPNLGPLTDPPFYAVRVLAGTIGTKGGPVTDIDGTVLTKAGAPIPGLYAAGNAASFWTADAYPGPGATLAVGMTMGYRSGCHAADPGGKGTGYINA